MINYEVQNNPLQIFVNLHPQNPIIEEKNDRNEDTLKMYKTISIATRTQNAQIMSFFYQLRR